MTETKPRVAFTPQPKGRGFSATRLMRKLYPIILIASILLIGVYLRLQLLIGGAGSGTLFEPDAYIYMLKGEAILSHNLTIPPINPLSGYPTHFPYPENPGMGYLQVIVYLLLFKAVSLYEVMLALPVAFGIFGMLLAYLITKKLTDNPYVPLLAMLFFAIIPAAVFRTSATEFRADSFVPIFAMLPALLLPITTKKSKIIFILSLIAICAAAVFMWTGGIYVVVCIVLMFLIYLLRIAPRINLVRNRIILFKALSLSVLAILLIAFPYIISLHYGTSSKLIGEIQATTLSYLDSAYGTIVFFLALMFFIIPVLFTDKAKDKQVYLYVLAFFIITLGLQLWQQRWSDLLVLPASIFAALGAYEITKLLKFDKVFYYGIILIIPAIVISSSLLNIMASAKTADFQTPATMQTLAWIRNNTPTNSTWLTLWPDGSLIEGGANRTVYIDSMAAAGMYRANLSRFFFAKAGNLTFISTFNSLPDYLWIRYALLNESDSIALMGNLSINTSLQGTNLRLLENGTNLTEGDLSLRRVFNNTDGYVYTVVKWTT